MCAFFGMGFGSCPPLPSDWMGGSKHRVLKDQKDCHSRAKRRTAHASAKPGSWRQPRGQLHGWENNMSPSPLPFVNGSDATRGFARPPCASPGNEGGTAVRPMKMVGDGARFAHQVGGSSSGSDRHQMAESTPSLASSPKAPRSKKAKHYRGRSLDLVVLDGGYRSSRAMDVGGVSGDVGRVDNGLDIMHGYYVPSTAKDNVSFHRQEALSGRGKRGETNKKYCRGSPQLVIPAEVREEDEVVGEVGLELTPPSVRKRFVRRTTPSSPEPISPGLSKKIDEDVRGIRRMDGESPTHPHPHDLHLYTTVATPIARVAALMEPLIPQDQWGYYPLALWGREARRSGNRGRAPLGGKT